MKYDIIADWQINLYCNFSCEYCFQSTHGWHKKELMGHKNIEDIVSFFDETKLKWLVHMSGGEPFLQPEFIKLCQLLIRKHNISMNTNLNINLVKDFTDKITPSKVAFINASLHYNERQKRKAVELYIKNYKLLQNSGFNIFPTQIFYPPLIKEFETIFEYFKEKGIVVRPKTFRGFYKYKQYPFYYSTKERELFLKYSKLAQKLDPKKMYQIDPNLDRQFLDGDLDFRGIRCDAGRKFVWIKYNGDIVRCHAATKVMGNLFKGKLSLSRNAKICPFKICLCPYYGLEYAKGKPQVLKPPYISRLKTIIREI